MSADRLWTWQRATALVPLALLSGAWTASLATSTTATAAAEDGRKPLPDGTLVPAEVVEAPASVSVPGEIVPGLPDGATDAVIADSSTDGIPAAALAAYQRAAQVLDSADSSCHISWPLIAAIGRVESNHGRYGGNTLTDDGVSRPGIYGIPLDGSNGVARIDDTDGGALDDDRVFDRAVGPMQFIPSTWAVVGVDGDGDGIRNPQDIDDAALATAVYLCSGDEDLSTTNGLRSAVYRYNHSEEYVDLVLAVMAAYAKGDFSAIPNGSFAPTTFAPSFAGPDLGLGSHKADGRKDGNRSGGTKSSNGPGTDGRSGGDAAGGDSGDGPAGGDSGGLPSLPGSGGDGEGGGSGTGGTVGDVTEPVQETLVTTAQVIQLCTSELQRQFDAAPQQAVDQCVAALRGKPLKQAQASVTGVVSGLSGLLDSLLGGGGGLLGGGGGGDGAGAGAGDGDGGGLLGGDGPL
jgi:membrane-bound lytic murein transglycosylase B